ncbi:MAG: hypothetical protein AAB726_02455 [Patescibacteria group bacterium]
MSKQEIVESVKEQIAFLNSKIDHKIIRGRSYMTEARRHKRLLSELNRLEVQMMARRPRSFSFFHFPTAVTSR